MSFTAFSIAFQKISSVFELGPVYRNKRFLAQLKRHEGERLTAYLDSLGVLTVGVGHNCIASPVPGVTKPGDKITQEISDSLFAADVAKHSIPLIAKLPWIEDTLSAPRQAVLFNMAFNLGVAGLLKFTTTLGYIERGDFEGAATNLLSNKKWVGQVKYRAYELAEQLRTGRWQGK